MRYTLCKGKVKLMQISKCTRMAYTNDKQITKKMLNLRERFEEIIERECFSL